MQGNEPGVSVDHGTTDPVVRWDSYENFNLHHEDSVEGMCTQSSKKTVVFLGTSYTVKYIYIFMICFYIFCQINVESQMLFR